jgi:hypothetical protein
MSCSSPAKAWVAPTAKPMKHAGNGPLTASALIRHRGSSRLLRAFQGIAAPL